MSVSERVTQVTQVGLFGKVFLERVPCKSLSKQRGKRHQRHFYGLGLTNSGHLKDDAICVQNPEMWHLCPPLEEFFR